MNIKYIIYFSLLIYLICDIIFFNFINRNILLFEKDISRYMLLFFWLCKVDDYFDIVKYEND